MDIKKYMMREKFDVLEDVDLNTALLTMQEIVLKWYKAKPENPDLVSLKDAAIVLTRICNKLSYEKKLYHLTISEYRSDKLRAIERARSAEKQT
jgi:hypothetical protein|tara:strand:- start:372 stop:653 length:282 start_codon:yes stop_codon:yes gene_type:complete